MDDTLSIRWNDPNYPYKPLTRHNVLEYFEHSPFYDRNSNNAEARAKGMDPSDEQILR